MVSSQVPFSGTTKEINMQQALEQNREVAEVFYFSVIFLLLLPAFADQRPCFDVCVNERSTLNEAVDLEHSPMPFFIT